MTYVSIPNEIDGKTPVGMVGHDNITKATSVSVYGGPKQQTIDYYKAAIVEFEAARDYFEAMKWEMVHRIGKM